MKVVSKHYVGRRVWRREDFNRDMKNLFGDIEKHYYFY